MPLFLVEVSFEHCFVYTGYFHPKATAWPLGQYIFGIVWYTGEVLAMNGIHNHWKYTVYQQKALFEISTGSLEMSARGYGSLHFPSMLIPNVCLQGFVVWMSFRAPWTFNFSLLCSPRISRVIFWSLFSDQRKRHVDLGVSVEMYSHCIFQLTNLKTVSVVPVALVFKSPSCCWRALLHHSICKDQNNGKKMSIHRCCIVSLSIIMFFLSNWENMGSQGKLIDCGWFKDFFCSSSWGSAQRWCTIA